MNDRYHYYVGIRKCTTIYPVGPFNEKGKFEKAFSRWNPLPNCPIKSLETLYAGEYSDELFDSLKNNYQCSPLDLNIKHLDLHDPNDSSGRECIPSCLFSADECAKIDAISTVYRGMDHQNLLVILQVEAQ